VWTEFSWLKKGQYLATLETVLNLWNAKKLEVSQSAGQISTFQEALCIMMLADYLLTS
jgi:hypothetical protein